MEIPRVNMPPVDMPHIPQVDPPNMSALHSMMEDLQKSMEDLPKTQEKMLSLSAEKWSDDNHVRVVVGPRGQLVDLEIDPRALRKPDARRLSATILSLTQDAVREVGEQSQELLRSHIPPEVADMRAQYAVDDGPGDDLMAQMLRTDADIYAERQGE